MEPEISGFLSKFRAIKNSVEKYYYVYPLKKLLKLFSMNTMKL